jgi:deoxycytidylate deaminase
MKLPRGVLELAVSQALKSPMQHKHGAVIWKSKTILGAGYNQHISAPSHNSRNVSIHSEKDCLTGLRCDQIYGANILAIRVTKSGNLSHGAPCNGCKKLLKRKGVLKVYWYDNQENLNVTHLN